MADILPNCIVKEEHLLIHHGNLLQHPFCRHGLNGLPSDGNLAALRFVVFGDQIENGGFAGTGVSYNCGELSCRRRKGQLLQHRLSRHIGEGDRAEGDVLLSRMEGRHGTSLLRFRHHLEDIVLGDHQVLPFKEIDGNGSGKLGQQNGQHGDHEIIHIAQRTGCPGTGCQRHDGRHTAPAENVIPEANRDALCLVQITHPAEPPHRLSSSLILDATHMIGTEGLDTVDVLHDAADRLGTDLMLGHAVFGNNAEGKPQIWDQPRYHQEKNQPRRQIHLAYKAYQHGGQHRVFGDVAAGVGQDLLVAAHIAGHGIHIFSHLSLSEAGKRDLFELVTQPKPQSFGNSSSAQLNLRVTGGVDDQSNQEDARKKRSQQPEPLCAQAALRQPGQNQINGQVAAPGQQPFHYREDHTGIEGPIFTEHICLTHAAHPLPRNRQWHGQPGNPPKPCGSIHFSPAPLHGYHSR